MKTVYAIRTCCGGEVERIEIELPAGCVDPFDIEAEAEALSITGYDDQPRCGHCGERPYRARYMGHPMAPIAATVMSVEGLDRDHLIAALETLLARLRVAPGYVSRVTCDDDKGLMF